MDLIFVDEPPAREIIEPVLISGAGSLNYNGVKYIVAQEDGIIQFCFEIRYEYSCSPFRDAMIIDGLLAVGFEEYFYLYSLNTKSDLLCLKMDGYFGYLYLNEGMLYVADAGYVYCIDRKAIIKWKSGPLGIDGVIINDFDAAKISGEGEWDPPGGWLDFVLDKNTGTILES